MSFLQPTFLWALGLLAVPILIHLFNFRKYQRVVFSNVEMLKDIQTESRKTRQIKRWLILATRLLALAALILAFAQPYLPSNEAIAGRSLVSIYLDNSESMRAEGPDGELLENGKNVARELLQNLPQDAKVQVLDNALGASSNRVYSPEKALKLIDDMAITYHPNDLPAVLQRVSNKVVAEGYESQYTFAISDFQGSNFPVVVLDSSLQINAFRLQPEQERNLSVDSVWLTEPVIRPNTPIELKIRVVNNGNVDVESSTAVFRADGVQQGVESFSLAANSSKDLSVNFNTGAKGWISGEVSISDVPIVFDNTYYFTLPLNQDIKVLQIGSSSKAIAKIFASDPIFSYSTMASGSIDYASLTQYDFVVLNELPEIGSGLAEAVKSVLQSGGTVCVIPADGAVKYAALQEVVGGATYGAIKLAGASVRERDLKHPFISDAYKSIPRNTLLPKVNRCYTLKLGVGSEEILTLKNGNALLSQTRIGSGKLFQLSVPMASSYSNLADHEVFVLSMLKMAFSKTYKQRLAYSLEYRDAIALAGAAPASQVTLSKGDDEIIVENSMAQGKQQFWLNDELQGEGVYSVNNEKGELLAKVALNQSRWESKQKYITDKKLSEQIQGAQVSVLNGSSADIKESLNGMQRGTALWKVFIGLCLLFLLIEVLLLRYLKA